MKISKSITIFSLVFFLICCFKTKSHAVSYTANKESQIRKLQKPITWVKDKINKSISYIENEISEAERKHKKKFGLTCLALSGISFLLALIVPAIAYLTLIVASGALIAGLIVLLSSSKQDSKDKSYLIMRILGIGAIITIFGLVFLFTIVFRFPPLGIILTFVGLSILIAAMLYYSYYRELIKIRKAS